MVTTVQLSYLKNRIKMQPTLREKNVLIPFIGKIEVQIKEIYVYLNN